MSIDYLNSVFRFFEFAIWGPMRFVFMEILMMQRSVRYCKEDAWLSLFVRFEFSILGDRCGHYIRSGVEMFDCLFINILGGDEVIDLYCVY